MEVNKKILLLAPGNLDPKMSIFDTLGNALTAIPEWQRERGMIVRVKYGATVKEYWWDSDDLSDLALTEKVCGCEDNPVEDQILAADTKETPANTDVFGYVNSAESENGQLRKFTWANLKASLKTFFDEIYSTFSPTTSGDGSKFLSDAGDYREAGGSGTIPISPSAVTRNIDGLITKNIVTVSVGVTIESRFNYVAGVMTFFEIKNQVTGEWKRVTINYTEAVYTSKTVEIIEAWTI